MAHTMNLDAIRRIAQSRTFVTAVPLLLVNAVAFTGQLAFLSEHLSWPLAGDIIFAASLESVAIFLAYMAHAALLGNDSSTRLRLSSYAFGIMIGLMNASHYVKDGQVTFAAVALGLMSSSSPFLWSVYSRRQSRDALMANGFIERHAIRLGINRWLLHPCKSFRVFRQATWTGEQNANAAIERFEHGQAVSLAADEPLSLPGDGPVGSKAHAVRLALAEMGEDADAPSVSAWLHDRGHEISAAYVRQVKRLDRRNGAMPVPASSGPQTGNGRLG
jgi:hypothetical protein